MKLFLKGERCYGPNCAIEKRNYVPGQHGKTRRPKKIVGYGLQLREKQRVRRIYGVLEQQFRNYYQKAVQMKGVVGENLLALLERRLDSVVFRMGFAASRSQARQIVGHGHIQVNGAEDGYSVLRRQARRCGGIARLQPDARRFLTALEASAHGLVPSWIEMDRDNFKAKITGMPRRDELVQIPINEQLIVELYSR